MTSKHTQGPWRAAGRNVERSNGTGLTIAICSGAGEYAEANARLIAAAPEMLAELRWQRTLAVRRFNAALEADANGAELDKLQAETDRIERALAKAEADQ